MKILPAGAWSCVWGGGGRWGWWQSEAGGKADAGGEGGGVFPLSETEGSQTMDREEVLLES